MTKEEVFNYLEHKKDMEHEVSSIYKHTKYTWRHNDGMNIFTCVCFEDGRYEGHNSNFVASSGARDHLRKCAIGRKRQKTYKLNTLTPELLDEIVDDVLPQLYSEVNKYVKLYIEKQKLKSIEKDF
jgi:hypothetical protein